MNCLGPMCARASLTLPLFSWGPEEITGRSLIEGVISQPVDDLVSDPSKHLTLAAQIASLPAQTLYLAERPFIATDTDQPYAAGLSGDLKIECSVIESGLGGFAINASSFSALNTGTLDGFADTQSINGQAITFTLLERPPDGPDPSLAEGVTVAVLHGETMALTRERLTFKVQDPAASLDVPVQQSVFAGTGGLEGGAELAGKRHPYGDGVVVNATPALVNGPRGKYKYSSTVDASSNLVVRNGGVVLALHADYATQALLDAAWEADAIPPGEYGSCVAAHYFQLGGSPQVKQITCDFTGPNLTTADIVEYAALNSAGLASGDLEAHTFAALNAIQGASVGYYLGSESSETCRTMFARLTRGIGGFAGMTPTGKLYVGRFDAPAGGLLAGSYDVTGSIHKAGIVEIDRVDLPAGLDPPPQRWRVPYARNWTPQSDLFGIVSEDDPAFADYLAQPWKLTSTTQEQIDTVLALYPKAPDGEPVDAFFAEESDAQAECDRLHAFATAGYKAYRVRLAHAMFKHTVGLDVIRISDSSASPRLGLGAPGKYVRIASMSTDLASRMVDATVIG